MNAWRRLPAVLLAVLALLLQACAPAPSPARPEGAPLPGRFVPVDLRPLLRPAHDYLGVSFGGLPEDGELDGYAQMTGRRPNLLLFFLGWGDDLPAERAGALWREGTLPFAALEPFGVSLAEIASGGQDEYIRRFARQVRDANVPLALSFGHEMNGWWYPWGACSRGAYLKHDGTRRTAEHVGVACRGASKRNKPSHFTAAWKRVRSLFLEEGAVGVIWIWSPNVVGPVPDVLLHRYYPGDAHVDWIGVVGYFRNSGPSTYDALFGSTFAQIRRFTRRPFLLAETAVAAGPGKPARTAGLLRRVAEDRDVIGMVWFNLDKESDWRVNSSPAALRSFTRGVSDPRFASAP